MACVRYRRGRWVIDFYDQEGIRRWHTMPKGSTRNEANEKCGEVEKQIRHGTYTPIKDMPPFPKVADSWLASREPNLRHSTFRNYKGHAENYLKPYFKNLKINQVNFDAIETFKTKALKGELPAEKERYRKVNPPTLRKILTTLGGILKYAVRRRYIEYNPVREIEKPKAKTLHDANDEIAVLKPKEIRVLLDKAGSQKDRALFMAAALTGMREGELLGLKWDDIDWFNCQIHVRRTYNNGRFYDPKTKYSRRKVDLAPELVRELKKWKLACPRGELNLVFPTEKGTPESQSNMLRRRFHPALRRAGLPKMRFHDLRHTYASLLIAQGENPKYIQTQLGHSSIQITMDVYGHLMDTVNREAASKLGRTVLGGNSEGDGSKTVAETKKEVNSL
ncbi:MAG: site-specific integrase [Desulfobacteria bacterium]